MGCRAGRMALAGRRAYLYRFARPLPPLGAGDYMRPAGIVSVCGEGVGGGISSRFSLSRGSRGLSSCHLIISVVIAPLLALLFPASSSPISPPHVLRSRPLLLPPLVVIHVFSCDFLSLASTFLRRVGRGVLCLFASLVAALVPSSRSSHFVSPCLLAPRWIALVVLVFALRRRRLAHVLLLYRLPSLPVFRQAWAGRMAARYLLACSFVSTLR